MPREHRWVLPAVHSPLPAARAAGPPLPPCLLRFCLCLLRFCLCLSRVCLSLSLAGLSVSVSCGSVSCGSVSPSVVDHEAAGRDLGADLPRVRDEDLVHAHVAWLVEAVAARADGAPQATPERQAMEAPLERGLELGRVRLVEDLVEYLIADPIGSVIDDFIETLT